MRSLIFENIKCFEMDFFDKTQKIYFILFSVCSSTFTCMTDLNLWTQTDTVSRFILTVCPWFGLSIGSQMCARYYGDFVVCFAFLLTHTWKVWSNLHPVQFIGLTLIFKPFWKLFCRWTQPLVSLSVGVKWKADDWYVTVTTVSFQMCEDTFHALLS